MYNSEYNNIMQCEKMSTLSTHIVGKWTSSKSWLLWSLISQRFMQPAPLQQQQPPAGAGRGSSHVCAGHAIVGADMLSPLSRPFVQSGKEVSCPTFVLE
jgi:hypothetical protein